MAKLRRNFSDARRRISRRGGQGLKTVPQAKTGKLIYKNPEAKPVSKWIATSGRRKPFTLENAAWIRKRGQIAEGGFGKVFAGRIKFRGKESSENCVIKMIDKNPITGK